MQQNQQNNFKRSAFIIGGLFGLLYFVLTVINGYMTINLDTEANPLFNISTFGPIFICLITISGGVTGVWYYANQTDEPLTMGGGAGLGAIVGFVMIAVAILMEYFWSVINPDFYDQMFQKMIEMYENSKLPDEQKQMLMDQTNSSLNNKFSLSGIFWQFISGSFTALLNALTGMLGVKLFINQPDEF